MNSLDINCRSCGHASLVEVLDLGMQPLANNLLKEDSPSSGEPRFSLKLTVCPSCHLAQISDLVPPVELFGEYLYFSSFSDTMLTHAREAALSHTREFGLDADSLVIEIASNDGYLLQNFQEKSIPCLGIEPASNIAKVAREKGIQTLERFFGLELAKELSGKGQQADLILGNNVFAHAPDTNDFVGGLAELLKPGGRIVLEFPYAVDFVRDGEFDTIYHEHVFYFSLTALLPLMARHGLDIFRVQKIPIHGGSLRLFACHAGAYPVEGSVEALASEERASGFDTIRPYQELAEKAFKTRTDLRQLLTRLKSEGKSIAAYGASAKGSTLLNFCGITREEIDFIADRSTAKRGLLSPGLHLPITGPEELTLRQPDFTLLLVWNFAEEILKQQEPYRKAGGQFILPLPEVRMV